MVVVVDEPGNDGATADVDELCGRRRGRAHFRFGSDCGELARAHEDGSGHRVVVVDGAHVRIQDDGVSLFDHALLPPHQRMIGAGFSG